MSVTIINPLSIDYSSYCSSSPSFNIITLTMDDGTVVLRESVSLLAEMSYVISLFVHAMLLYSYILFYNSPYLSIDDFLSI